MTSGTNQPTAKFKLTDAVSLVISDNKEIAKSSSDPTAAASTTTTAATAASNMFTGIVSQVLSAKKEGPTAADAQQEKAALFAEKKSVGNTGHVTFCRCHVSVIIVISYFKFSNYFNFCYLQTLFSNFKKLWYNYW